MEKWRSALLSMAVVAALTAGCIPQPVNDTSVPGADPKGANPPMSTPKMSAWDAAVVTSGGITGRGLGDVTVSSTGAGHVTDPVRGCDAKVASRDLENLANRVANTEAFRWQDSYASPANPHGYADQIRYELTLSRTVDGTTEKRTTFWYDDNVDALPADLAALYDAIWGMREQLLAQCK